MGSLVAAYTAAWIILMVYVFTLAARQRRLRRSLEALESDAASGRSEHPGSHGR
ncbi:MAG: CcmD family protein [Terriglobales bacterium]